MTPPAFDERTLERLMALLDPTPTHYPPGRPPPTERDPTLMASTSTSTTQSKDTKAKAPATRKDTKAAPTHDQPQAPTSEQVDAVRERRRQLED